jgi:hypothetical protein
MADNLPPSSADVTESGSLNLPRTLWAPQASNGITLPLPFTGYDKNTSVYITTFILHLQLAQDKSKRII